jgi:hypothetical protein
VIYISVGWSEDARAATVQWESFSGAETEQVNSGAGEEGMDSAIAATQTSQATPSLFHPGGSMGSAETERPSALRSPGAELSSENGSLSGLPSPEDVKREIAHVLEKQLSPDLMCWAERYARVGKRNLYLWKWARQGVEVTTLPCVSAELRDEVCDTKVLGVMLDVLVDDVADQNGDDLLLEYLLDLPLGRTTIDLTHLPAEQQAYARFTTEVWQAIQTRAQRFPRFQEYASLLRYDYLQVFNTMRYSHLVNRNLELLNLTEHDMYLPHNMHMMVSGTLDLMCSPYFDRWELGRLREVVWCGQCMGRIGNLVTTWERELGDKDYTSGVYARAVTEGDLTIGQLLGADRESIKAAIQQGQHEAYFLRRWQEHRQHLLSKRGELLSFDVGELVAGLQRLICLHLGSRGYK